MENIDNFCAQMVNFRRLGHKYMHVLHRNTYANNVACLLCHHILD